MKIKTALNYLLKKKMIFGIFFSLFIFCLALLALIGGDTGTVEVDLITGIIFTLIITFIGRGNDFKFFIQNGMTRQSILVSEVLANIIFSFVFSLILILFYQLFALPLIPTFSLTNLLVNVYTKGEFLSGFVLQFVLLAVASLLGMMLGIFNDRFVGLKKVLILLLFCLIPAGLLRFFHLTQVATQRKIVHALFTMLGKTPVGLKLLPFVLTLVGVVVINVLISYLLNRKRELQVIK